MKYLVQAVKYLVPASVATSLAAVAAGPTTRPADADATAGPAAFPIAYFNANCAGCHGDYGSFWGDGFAADYGDDELREVVAEMAAGPAFAPLDGPALDVQTAYNRSLTAAATGPFLVISALADGVVSGEVTPGSAVTVDGTPATVDGHRWSAEATAAARVTAVRAGVETRVEVPASAALPRWSHAAGGS